MVKDKTLEMEKKEKIKRAGKGSTASFQPPTGWIQEDWLPSKVTEKEVHNLATDGLIPEKGWRLPGLDELEPAPTPEERVLLISHIDRGLSMPPHPFFRSFLSYFGAQLHHIPPNAMVYLSAFVSLCENFLGCQPHWGLFKHIFSCRPQMSRGFLRVVRKPT